MKIHFLRFLFTFANVSDMIPLEAVDRIKGKTIMAQRIRELRKAKGLTQARSRGKLKGNGY